LPKNYPFASTGNYISILSTVNGCYSNDSLALERWADSSWHSLSEYWQLYVDFAIFPKIILYDTCYADMGLDKEICPNKSTVLKAIGGEKYYWSTGVIADSIIVKQQ
jgi:hypothetical protein